MLGDFFFIFKESYLDIWIGYEGLVVPVREGSIGGERDAEPMPDWPPAARGVGWTDWRAVVPRRRTSVGSPGTL